VRVYFEKLSWWNTVPLWVARILLPLPLSQAPRQTATEQQQAQRKLLACFCCWAAGRRQNRLFTFWDREQNHLDVLKRSHHEFHSFLLFIGIINLIWSIGQVMDLLMIFIVFNPMSLQVLFVVYLYSPVLWLDNWAFLYMCDISDWNIILKTHQQVTRCAGEGVSLLELWRVQSWSKGAKY